MNKARDFKFDKMASSYDVGLKGKVLKKFYDLLIKRIDVRQDATVLDVGCGTGSVLKLINEVTNINGYGIDIEENMIIEAKQKCPTMNIQVSSCTETPFGNNKFDVITTCLAFHHFADKEGFARETARILKPDGILYITDPNFSVAIRKSLNLAFRIHRIVGFFAAPKEIEEIFSKYGFLLLSVCTDKYVQCIALRKAS